MANMTATRINDFYTSNGTVRPDGRMIYDMCLVQVKDPKESMYPWDYDKVKQTIPGAQAYTSRPIPGVRYGSDAMTQ